MMYLGIFGIIIVGTLLHFIYEWSHHNKCVAVFAAVNESVWEHIKIAMTPTFIWLIICGFHYGWTPYLLIASVLCLSTIILLIPALFYSYTAFTKKAILPVDIICFCITIICSQLVFFHFLNLYVAPLFCIIVSVVMLIIELFVYFAFSFFPPKNLFFKDPITKKYGLEGHPCRHNHHHNHKHSHKQK
ncbi:hypothetical protein IJS18_01690 [Candidatus Saccharibacteria bacterium]|nr:hypothetical protein [Candidatus Saccharibacteria bacterium]